VFWISPLQLFPLPPSEQMRREESKAKHLFLVTLWKYFLNLEFIKQFLLTSLTYSFLWSRSSKELRDVLLVVRRGGLWKEERGDTPSGQDLIFDNSSLSLWASEKGSLVAQEETLQYPVVLENKSRSPLESTLSHDRKESCLQSDHSQSIHELPLTTRQRRQQLHSFQSRYLYLRRRQSSRWDLCR
jgi:hypothetical protein